MVATHYLPGIVTGMEEILCFRCLSSEYPKAAPDYLESASYREAAPGESVTSCDRCHGGVWLPTPLVWTHRAMGALRINVESSASLDSALPPSSWGTTHGVRCFSPNGETFATVFSTEDGSRFELALFETEDSREIRLRVATVSHVTDVIAMVRHWFTMTAEVEWQA